MEQNYKFPAWESPAGARLVLWVVAEKGEDLHPVLAANRRSVVFPSPDRLIRYTQNVSYLHVRKTQINPLLPKMLSERRRILCDLSSKTPIHRK